MTNGREHVELLPAQADDEDLSALRHAVEHGPQRFDWPSDTQADRLDGLGDREQVQRHLGVLGREDLLEDAQLNPALGRRETVRELVELRREASEDVVHVGLT